MANYSYALILVGLINLFFALYTWQSARESQSVKFFALSVFSVGLWGFGLAGFLNSNSVLSALNWAKFHYVASIYVAYFLLIFILAVSQKGKVSIWKQLLLQIPIIFVSFVTIFCNELLLQDVVLEKTGNVAILFRPGHLIYGMVFVVYYSVILFVNIYYIFRCNKVVRKQLSLIFLGLLLAGVLGGVFNLVLPLFGNYKLIWMGPLFTIIFLGLTFVGILKYQLFNIRLLVGKVAYVLAGATIIYGAFLLLYKLNVLMFQDIFDLEAIIFGVFISTAFTIFYEKYKKYLQEKINLTIMNPGFDPNAMTRSFNNRLAEITAREDVLIELYKVIDKSLKPVYYSVILKSKGKIINKQYSGNRAFNQESIFNSVVENSDFSREYIALSSLLGALQTQSSKFAISNRGFIKILQENDIRLLVPVYYSEDLIALLVLGKRDLNDSPYIESEIEFLKSLASIVGISLVRAKLYEQVEDLNLNLKQKVYEQTEELQTKVKQLQEARKKEADMIDIMGHELRTPATIVKLNAELLQGIIEKKSLFALQKYVTRIQEGVDREIKLINTLLSSAKLEGDKIELNLEEVNLSNEIEMSLHAFEKDAQQKGLQLINNVPKDLPSVLGDHARIVEVVNNLISNAVKYTQKGSVTITAQDLGNFIQTNVTDTGQGIPAEDIPNLGKKFYRVKTYIESSQKTDDIDIVRPGGTGLGLYVVFNLVKKMGGNIKVTSEIDKGSTFSFTLPKYIKRDEMSCKTKSNNMFERLGLKN